MRSAYRFVLAAWQRSCIPPIQTPEDAMLQPLGISAEAETVYVALGPLPSATVDELAKRTSYTPDEVQDVLDQLGRIGLATESPSGSWHVLPLLDVVTQLKAQRFAEIELASVAAESLESHLLAAGATRTTTSRS